MAWGLTLICLCLPLGPTFNSNSCCSDQSNGSCTLWQLEKDFIISKSSFFLFCLFTRLGVIVAIDWYLTWMWILLILCLISISLSWLRCNTVIILRYRRRAALVQFLSDWAQWTTIKTTRLWLLFPSLRLVRIQRWWWWKFEFLHFLLVLCCFRPNWIYVSSWTLERLSVITTWL